MGRFHRRVYSGVGSRFYDSGARSAALLLNKEYIMGTLKVYQIKNIATAMLTFQLGKAKFRCNFDKGVLNVPNPRPATFSTDNTIVQLAIENSPLFGRKITLLSASETKPADRTSRPGYVSASGVPQQRRVFEDVTELGEVINILRGLGVPARKLKTEEAIAAASEEMGIEFPNVKMIQQDSIGA